MQQKTQLEVLIEWLRPTFPYVTTMILSMWGGLVNYIRMMRIRKQPFQLKELCFDLLTSSFAGLITFYLCKSAGIDPTKAAVLIAISGHMGTRAIASFEVVYKRLLRRS